MRRMLEKNQYFRKGAGSRRGEKKNKPGLPEETYERNQRLSEDCGSRRRKSGSKPGLPEKSPEIGQSLSDGSGWRREGRRDPAASGLIQ